MFGSEPGSTPDTPDAAPADATAEAAAATYDPATMVVSGAVIVAMLVIASTSATSVMLALPVLVPWGLLAWAYGRRADDDARGRRATMLIVLFGATALGALLALSAWFRAPLHESALGVAAPALVVAGVFGVALYVVVPAIRTPSHAALGVVASLLYGVGGGVTANLVFDMSEAEVVRATVVDKWVSNPLRTRRSTRADGPYFIVEVETYGSTRVDPEAYSYSKVGQPGCVHVRNGALGMEWFTIERCPVTPRTR